MLQKESIHYPAELLDKHEQHSIVRKFIDQAEGSTKEEIERLCGGRGQRDRHCVKKCRKGGI